MEEQIKQALINATDEIFLDWQAKLHVVSGDNDPWMVHIFDCMVADMARQMAVMLLQQPKLGIVKLEMLDGQLVNLSGIALPCDMVQKLAEVEKYLEEKEVI